MRSVRALRLPISRLPMSGSPVSRSRLAWTIVVLLVGAWVLWYGFVEGARFNERDPRIKLGAGPLVGEWRTRLNSGTLFAVAFATVLVWCGPSVVERLRVRWLMLGTALATSCFTIVLLLNDSRRAVLNPVTDKTEYWQVIAGAPSTGEFIETYLLRLRGYSVHLRGHPPGYPAGLLLGRDLGVTSPWFAAVLSWLAAGIGAAAVVYTVVKLAGADAARRLAPLMVVAPYAVWAGTSADAVYMCFGAVGVALLAAAATVPPEARRRTLRQAGLAGLAGLTLGMLCFGTYGAVMLAPVAIAVLAARRGWWLVVPTLAAGAVVVWLWYRAGFWWLEGAKRTRRQYWGGTAGFRSAKPFFVFNFAALMLAVGPVVVWSLTRVRRAPWMWLAAGGAVCVVASAISQYSKGEVERIWLLFMPWITVAAIGVVSTRRSTRIAIGMQAATAIVLQTALVSKW